MIKSFIRETVSTATLLISIVGSALLGQMLTQEVALIVLINGIATVAALYLLINLGGADLNPVVTLMKAIGKEISIATTLATLAAQFIGAVAGTIVANRMYAQTLVAISKTDRYTSGTLIAEVIATFGLLYIVKTRGNDAGRLVPAWILAAFFATSSTAFANPAVTVGRMFTNTFSGIQPMAGLKFIAGQIIALVLVVLVSSTKKGSAHDSNPA